NKTVDYENISSDEGLIFTLINESEVKPIGGTGSSKNDPEKYNQYILLLFLYSFSLPSFFSFFLFSFLNLFLQT
ncbi:hypothetical protein D1N57_20390, partial [Clostridioides difficile]|uniref:hypothetical protein n=1 Tax=Clostridioides difficile TaxID=1496 RepID=UPI00115E6DE8